MLTGLILLQLGSPAHPGAALSTVVCGLPHQSLINKILIGQYDGDNSLTEVTSSKGLVYVKLIKTNQHNCFVLGNALKLVHRNDPHVS